MSDPRPLFLHPLGWTGPQLLVILGLALLCFFAVVAVIALFVWRSRRGKRQRHEELLRRLEEEGESRYA